jgi:transcription elongation factor GreA
MAHERIPMTREGYEKKRGELEQKQNTEMIEVTKRIAAARELGDLSENAEYHAAREDQGLLQARIDKLKDELSRAEIVDPSALAGDTIVFGARVRIRDLKSGEEQTYELVGPGDEDYGKNKILTTSPRAQALLGKKQGEIVEVNVPRGCLRYEIVEISFPHG